MHLKHILRPLLATAIILMIPALAMLFKWQMPDPGQGTDGVNWTLADFAVMGALLFVTGFMIEIALKSQNRYRIVAAAGIFLAFLWLWAELAVGVFTNWGS